MFQRTLGKKVFACEQVLGSLRTRTIVYGGEEGRVEKGTHVVPWHRFQVNG